MTRFSFVLRLVFILPLRIDSQDMASIQALAVPAANVGTCVARTIQKANDRANAVTRSSLVMKTVPPNGSREISLFKNKAGTVFGYAEMSSVFVPPSASESDNILATYRPDGLSGTWTHVSIQMSDSGLKKVDTVSLRKMSEGAVRHSNRKALDAHELQQVRTLINWVSRRCPT